MEELTRSSRSGQVWELSQSLTVTGCEVRWGQLEISRNSYRTLTTTTTSTSSRDQMDGSVGLLLGRDISGELSQTERRGVRLQPGLASNITALRLLMVGQEGVRLSQERELDSQTCGYSQLLTPVPRKVRFELLGFCTCEKWYHMSNSDFREESWKIGS